MERRRAITMAAAASLTMLAGAGGIVLNSGLVGATGRDKVGTLSPVTAGVAPPVTVYATDPAAPAVERAPSIGSTTAVPVTRSSASAIGSDRRGDDEKRGGAEDDD